MLILVFQIIFVLSVLGILIIMLRKVPAVLKYPRHSSKTVPVHENIRNQWRKMKEESRMSNFLHERVIPKTEKILRRTKVVVLKFDNFLARRVNKLRERMRRRKRIK